VNERSKETSPQDFVGKFLIPTAIVSHREFPVSDEQIANKLVTSLRCSVPVARIRSEQVRENGGSKRKVRIIIPQEVG
jgi:hypothetical protein